MRAVITIDIEVTKRVLDQMRRNGFEVIKEGGGLTIRVPNCELTHGCAVVSFEEPSAKK